MLERFYREARASATIRSPNICPVFDVGEIDGQHYITMAFIEGRPLRDFTKSKKSHSEKQVITTIRKLALGLAEAHEIGKKKPIGWGLHDIHGNVWEWCHDWHGGGLQGGIDPQGPVDPTRKLKVYRGGCWDGDFQESGRSANQHRYGQGHKLPTLGFRVVLSSMAQPESP
jgi:hypothetical protein